MTKYQASIIAGIEKLKKQLREGGCKKDLQSQMKKLAHMLTQPDCREYELRNGRRGDPGGRSRSPSMGRWKRDDESLI